LRRRRAHHRRVSRLPGVLVSFVVAAGSVEAKTACLRGGDQARMQILSRIFSEQSACDR
jgi:hypothetical protein